ncbi:MAG: SDR family oxidoreductase, partial [Pararhodobacter sp.]
MSANPEWESALSGKAVLITGASRGIGAATARLFAAKGARLGLAGRPGDALQAVAIETGATLLPCDVADFDAVQGAVNAMVERFGALDVLINNAGVIDPIAPLESVDPAAWARQIDVNLKGVFYGMRAALP